MHKVRRNLIPHTNLKPKIGLCIVLGYLEFIGEVYQMEPEFR